MVEWRHRVGFWETDGMGVVYHGNYLNWLEAARVEYLRALGIVLSDLTGRGILFPIVSICVKYLSPARFDDVVVVRARLLEASRVRLVFSYEIFRKDGTRLAKASSEGTFTSLETGRVLRLPADLAARLLAAAKEEEEEEEEEGYRG